MSTPENKSITVESPIKTEEESVLKEPDPDEADPPYDLSDPSILLF